MIKKEGWEKIAYETERLKIKDGWLVWRMDHEAGGLTFVPDKDHEWEI